MKITLSAIKADIGSIGGHIKPDQKVIDAVKSVVAEACEAKLVIDWRVSFTGDDIAILMSHERGENSEVIHGIAWNAFEKGTAAAKELGLYGAGQDLLADAFSGNIKGLGPAVAEMEFKERENEPFIFFAADKTDPGAYNLPFYLAYCDPMHNSGLIVSEGIGQGYRFSIMDVSHTEGDRVIELQAPEEVWDIATLLRDNQRFVIEKVFSRASGEVTLAVSTTRLHNIAGRYTGKDDPIALARVQGNFPATGEILSPFAIGHYVAGFMRGSHNGPLMPVKQNMPVSFFDGPPIVSGAAYCVHNGVFTEKADVFDHPFWNRVRDNVSDKALSIREQGFSGPAMLGYDELEYGGIVTKMERLDKRFQVR